MKVHWPGPGVNAVLAKMFNLYWDPRDEYLLKTQGVCAGTPFVRMRVQHLRMKDTFLDWNPASGMPNQDVENLRMQMKKMVETWLKIYGDAKDMLFGIEAAGNQAMPKSAQGSGYCRRFRFDSVS
jgi:arylsulfatase